MAPKTIEITSPDGSSQVVLNAEQLVVTLHHAAPESGVAVSANVDLTGRLTEDDQDVFAALCQAADAPGTDGIAAARVAGLGQRSKLPLRRVAALVGQAADWLIRSAETTNHTYALSDINKTYLCHTLAVVAGISPQTVRAYMDEVDSDNDLTAHISTCTAKQSSALQAVTNTMPQFGRRLGWYALVRILKPRLVIETGVDKGLGSVLLCAALKRNAAEGAQGRYLGTDINDEAGYLLAPPYDDYGGIAFGDSLETLAAIDEPIDLFINDSDHSADYEADEYRCIAPHLSEHAVVLGDNAHVTSRLAEFAENTGRQFLYWQERPTGHWYPGGGIGFAFR